MVILFAITMSIFAYVRLSTNPLVLKVAILVLAALWVGRLADTYGTSSKLQTALEAAYFLLFMAIVAWRLF